MAATDTALLDARGIDTLESRNPATGEVLGTVPVLGPADVAAAVERARTAAAAWGALSHAERRDHLVAWRREIVRRADDLADLVHRENGKPRLDALQEVMSGCNLLTFAATRAGRVLRTRRVSPGLLANHKATVSYHPLGVVGVIGPWNYPVHTPMGSIAFALAAGNTVVFKPSELTPLVGAALADAAAAAIPIPDVLQAVTGDGRTGHALATSDVDKLSFTGSAATGKKVMAAAAENLTPVVLELGGKDPLIVAADADVDAAAEAAVYGAFTNAGQACVSIERAYVVDNVYDAFVDRVVAAAREVKAGAGDDAQIGAITRPEQVDVIRDHIADAVAKGARVLVGGADAVHDSFVEPTVLVDVTPDMRVSREETFGPVLPIVKVASAEDAVALANDVNYGLGSAVFGRAGVRGLAERIRSGMTSVNSVMTFSGIPTLPFGGLQDSGFGRIHGDEGLREFSHVKAITELRFPLPIDMLTFKQPKNAYQQTKLMLQQVFGGGVVDRAQSRVRKVTGR